MYSGLDLQQVLFQSIQDHKQLIKDQMQLGLERAEAERVYRMEKKKRTAYERVKGTPVSIIGDIVKGYEDIANLAYERDCAQVLEEANKERIMASKREIDIIREQINREYYSGGNDV